MCVCTQTYTHICIYIYIYIAIPIAARPGGADARRRPHGGTTDNASIPITRLLCILLLLLLYDFYYTIPIIGFTILPKL